MKFIYSDGGREAAGFTGKKVGDCVCRSICIVTGLSYSIVYDRLAEGNKHQRVTKRSRTKSSVGVATASHGIYTKRKWFTDYMKELGFAWKPLMKIGTGCQVHLEEGELPKQGRFILALSRHYTSLIDGDIYDTYDPRRSKSYNFEPDRGQTLKPNQGRNQNGVWTEIGGRCCYGYWEYKG